MVQVARRSSSRHAARPPSAPDLARNPMDGRPCLSGSGGLGSSQKGALRSAHGVHRAAQGHQPPRRAKEKPQRPEQPGPADPSAGGGGCIRVRIRYIGAVGTAFHVERRGRASTAGTAGRGILGASSTAGTCHPKFQSGAESHSAGPQARQRRRCDRAPAGSRARHSG
jgi:hypothetical protein